MVIVLAHGNLYCINVSAAGRPRCGCGSIIHLFGTEVKQIMKKTAFFRKRVFRTLTHGRAGACRGRRFHDRLRKNSEQKGLMGIGKGDIMPLRHVIPAEESFLCLR